MPEMSEVDAAWLATVIDGEGCIGIWRDNRRVEQHGFSGISVSNTNKAFVQKAAALTGGNVNTDSTGVLKRHKIAYRLSVPKKNLEYVLRAILPHLVIKQEQAVLVLVFLQTTSQERKMSLLLRCQVLNKKGS